MSDTATPAVTIEVRLFQGRVPPEGIDPAKATYGQLLATVVLEHLPSDYSEEIDEDLTLLVNQIRKIYSEYVESKYDRVDVKYTRNFEYVNI